MKAIILAGGKGRRLDPFTQRLPKPLLPIAGRPTIEWILAALAAAEIHDVAIVIGHLGQLIRDFAGSGTRFGLKLEYFQQEEQKGTGHAVALAQNFIDGDVMILAADTAFSRTHICGLRELHYETHADVSLSLKRLPAERIAATSSVGLDDSHRVYAFREKPPPGTELGNLAANLLHIYPRVLCQYLPRVALSARGEFELTAVIEPMIHDGLSVFGKEFSLAPEITDTGDLLRLNSMHPEAVSRLIPDQLAAGHGA